MVFCVQIGDAQGTYVCHAYRRCGHLPDLPDRLCRIDCLPVKAGAIQTNLLKRGWVRES